MKLKINEHQINNNNFIMKINFKNLRKNNIATMFAALFIITVLNFSCSKPENGTNGTNGVDGKNGINGTIGPTGTANVIYSNWANVTFTQPSSPGGDYLGNIQTNNISQSVLDNGVFLLYSKLSTSSEIFQLPWSNDFSYAYYVLQMGKVRIFTTNSAFSTAFFRYIIIPGGVPAGRSAMPQPNYKTMTYSQVCASLNIPE